MILRNTFIIMFTSIMLKTNRKLIIYNPPNFHRYNSITNLDLVYLGNFFNFSTIIFVAFFP